LKSHVGVPILAMMISCEDLLTVNRQQLEAMQKAGEKLRPEHEDSCRAFGVAVRNVQAALIHTYQLVAALAIRESDPRKAAESWRCMNEFCDQALSMLKAWKDVYPHCGTPELYDLALDYKIAAQERLTENMQDAEWLKNNPAPPNGLFQPMN